MAAAVPERRAAGTPPGFLDSDIILDSGTGNRALGHCTFDLGTNRGLCTFSGGTGQFTGFRARLDVSLASGSTSSYRLDGTYSFSPEAARYAGNPPGNSQAYAYPAAIYGRGRTHGIGIRYRFRWTVRRSVA